MKREEAIDIIRKNIPHLGIGATEMTAALNELIPELRESESEDERIRLFICDLITRIFWGINWDISKKDCLAYLEKQKDLDKMIVVSPEVWDNAISDAFENGKKEGEHPEKQKPSAPNKYDEKMRKKIIDHLESIKMGCVICTIDTSEEIAWLEKQKEQKQTDLPAGFYYIDLNGNRYYSKEFRYGDMKLKVGEQKPISQEDFDTAKHEALWGEQKPVDDSDFKTKLAAYLQNNSPKDGQYVISSESILEMAKEELIKRGELKEQKPH